MGIKIAETMSRDIYTALLKTEVNQNYPSVSLRFYSSLYIPLRLGRKHENPEVF
jgi:hypothetical protein